MELQDRARRGLNVAVAAVGLVMAAPIMALVAIAVRLTSPGPVLYSQLRVGLDRRSRTDSGGNGRRANDLGGRLFRIYKFRTMYVQRDGDARETWARPDDPRITAIGAVLRKLRLDELPQLWNVVRGEMNVVGPRPEQPRIFGELREQIGGYQRRQRVPPGITGWAQINHHYDRCLEDVQRKVAFDLEYIERQSFVEDIKIMAMTVPVMVARRGGW